MKTYTKTLLVILVIYYLFPLIPSAQPTLLWAKRMGGTTTDAGYSIAVDGSGNVFTTGKFLGTANLDPGAGTYNLTDPAGGDVFVSKLDGAGNFVYAKSMGGAGQGAGYSIALDGSGNIYTTGIYDGTADFDPGAGTYNLTFAGSLDVFVSKLDASGNFLWAKSLGGTSDDRGYSLAVDGSSNVYTTGYFYGTADFDPGAGTYNLNAAMGGSGYPDIFISKLDASGNFAWAKSIGGTYYDYGRAIAVDGSGNVYTVGSFYGTVDFDPGAGTYNLTSSNYDVFVSKLDGSGNFMWAKNMGGTGADDCWAIDVDASGDIYIAGKFVGVADFDPGAGTYNLTSMGTDDIFLSRLDGSGNLVWAVSAGGNLNDYAHSVTLDGIGNVYIMGDQYSATVDYDPGVATFNVTNTGTEASFIARYDINGNFLCAMTITPGHNETNFGDRHIAASGNSVWVTASFDNALADFDPCPANYYPGLYGNTDVYIAKYDFTNCNCTVLPVEWFSFTGRNEGDQNILEWTTASEINNDHFSVERSDEGHNFEKIGNVRGIVNTNEKQNYSFIDTNPFSGINYYRLKQTDYNSKFTYSKIISINNQQINKSVISIYPNPSDGEFTVSGLLHPVIIKIYNILGQEVYSIGMDLHNYNRQSVSLGESESFKLNLNSLPAGMYFLKAGNAQIKFIKQ